MFTHGNQLEFTNYFCKPDFIFVPRNTVIAEYPDQISELLLNWSSGDDCSLEQLVPLVESELKRIARNHLHRENGHCSMQISDLINEAYLKLVNQHSVQWKNRNHFFAVSSIIIRRILINHARDQAAGKRGGAALVLNVDDVEIISTEKSAELLALDEALVALAALDSTKARIVEMRFFGGLTAAEIGEVLGMPPAAVTRNWNLARAWLARRMRK
jgi:RNA polymerase sigma factor (TIGR02999 family)